MATRKFSFGSAETTTAGEVVIYRCDGKELARAIFPSSSLEPCHFRLFGVETHEWILREPEMALKQASTELRHADAIHFASYWWQKANATPNKKASKAALLNDARIQAMSKVLYHYYVAARQMDLIRKSFTTSHVELNLSKILKQSVGRLLVPESELPPLPKQKKTRCPHTNGCSYSPDGWWVECCDCHDECYDIGGKEADRLNCDRVFYWCLRRNAGPVIAWIYYTAVRLFGASHFNYHP